MRDVNYDVLVHGLHGLCCPFAPERLDRLVALLPLEPRARVGDLGCGKADLLVRIVKRHGALGVGIDVVAPYLAFARQRARAEGLEASLDFRHADVLTAEPPSPPFDLTLCIGLNAFGDAAATLRQVRRWTRPGGLILFGTDYRKEQPHARPPADPGPAGPQFHDIEGLVAVAEAGGGRLLYAMAATDEERDHYYGLSMLAVERGGADSLHRDRFRLSRDEYFSRGRAGRGFLLQLLAA